MVVTKQASVGMCKSDEVPFASTRSSLAEWLCVQRQNRVGAFIKLVRRWITEQLSKDRVLRRTR